MADRVWIVDASLMGSAFFEEAETQAARRFLARETHLLAPALLALEVASIASKKVWKNQTTPLVGERAVVETPRLVDLVEVEAALAVDAFRLAQRHRYSACDAAYLALAISRQAPLITLDAKLAARAEESGHGTHVRLLTDMSLD